MMHAFWQLMHQDIKNDAEKATIAAVTTLSTREGFSHLTPEEVFDRLVQDSRHSIPESGRAINQIAYEPEPPAGFQKELERLINRFSQENGSDTPDFILAQFLYGCLGIWNGSLAVREKWYGRPCGGGTALSGGQNPIPVDHEKQ